MNLWDRLAAKLLDLPEQIAEDHYRAKALLTELLTQPEVVREQMAVSFERFRSIALVELLLERSTNDPAPQEAVVLAELALAIAGTLDATGRASGLIEEARARSWMILGNACRRCGDLSRAQCAFETAAAHLASACDPLEESHFHRLRALLLRDFCQPLAAISVQERAVELLHGFGQPKAAAISLIELAALHLGMADIPPALDCLRAAVADLGSDLAPELGGLSPRSGCAVGTTKGCSSTAGGKLG